MPIIEYFHPSKTYRVSIARTVEWGTQVSPRKFPYAPYAPFVGVGEDGNLDMVEEFEFSDETEAFKKMAELWEQWKNAGFPTVCHA